MLILIGGNGYAEGVGPQHELQENASNGSNETCWLVAQAAILGTKGGHMVWFAVLAIGMAIALPWAVALAPRRFPPKSWWPPQLADHLTTLQTLLTVTALIFGAGWFLIERPDAAKLEVEQSTIGVQLPDNQVLVLVEIKLKNAGRASLDLRHRSFQIYLQKVTPLPREVLDEFSAVHRKDGTASIRPADTWSLIASLSEEYQGKGRKDPDVADLGAFIEAGEAENLYFRAIIPCEPDLRVYATFQMEKPRSGLGLGSADLWWIKQSFVDLTQPCSRIAAKDG